MHFAILTQNAAPVICGIGDHSLKFAEALRAFGHEATVVARRGEPSNGVAIVPGQIGRVWSGSLLSKLDQLGANHLILQYTPLMFSAGSWAIEHALYRSWRALSVGRAHSLIVHETYFRVWWRPLSLARGTIQRAMLKRLAQASGHIFTASQPLLDEMSKWHLVRQPVRLPIGSNVPLTAADGRALRHRLRVSEEEIVLTLFGGGNSLRWCANLVNTVDAWLTIQGIPHSWLLLGGVDPHWFSLGNRVIAPGMLTPADLSAHLQTSNLLLIPHVAGLSAKRGTLIAAMEHALPVVGTSGTMTDAFWRNVGGVVLVDGNDADRFAMAVSDLCSDAAELRRLGRVNADFFRNEFTWPQIASRFLEAIKIG